MENIQTEEEMQPLGTPTRRVAQAYSYKDSQNNIKKCAYYIFIFALLGFIVFVHNSEGDKKQKKRAQKLRNKAEIMPEKAVQKLQTAINNVELNEKMSSLADDHEAYYDDTSSSEDTALVNDVMKDEDDLEEEVLMLKADVELAEQNEIDTKNYMLTTAVKSMEDSIMSYLGRVFGYEGDDQEDDDDDAANVSDSSADIKLTEEQLDVIAKKISERLELDAKNEFKAKADSVTIEKQNEIENVLAEDRQAQMNARDIVIDVREAESVVVEDLKDEIDDVAEAVKDSLPEKAKKIRDSVVEEVTGKKLDDIENTKRAKTAKRKELRQKFEEMQAAKNDAQANLDSLKWNGGKNPSKVDEKMKKGAKRANSDGSAEDESKETNKVSDDSADDKSKDSDDADDKSKDSDDADDKSKDSDDADEKSKDSDDADDKSKDVKKSKKIYQSKVNKASSKSVDEEE
ncbi:hypothetical protein ACHAW5_010880 [Stephanodiscus triporus]|uniref:Uncharacterized protein n=1 Tax=Stephanodiscus triporus TaxID=2934178 RepID=A0ABD3MHT4_9STRA